MKRLLSLLLLLIVVGPLLLGCASGYSFGDYLSAAMLGVAQGMDQLAVQNRASYSPSSGYQSSASSSSLPPTTRSRYPSSPWRDPNTGRTYQIVGEDVKAVEISNVEGEGVIIETNDGFRWLIDESDYSETRSWSNGDRILRKIMLILVDGEEVYLFHLTNVDESPNDRISVHLLD